MQTRCIVVRILPGRGEAARELVTELAGSRRAEQESSARRIGTRSATWSVGGPAAGELLIGEIDGHDLGHALDLLRISLAPHDLWFKRRFLAVTGIDLNQPQQLTSGDEPDQSVLRVPVAAT
jgi:hypothetical protein